MKDLKTTVDKYKDGKEDFVTRKVAVAYVLDAAELKLALNSSSNFLPSEHLFELLREPLRPFLPSDTQYERAFDRFEYLLSLIDLDELMQYGGRPWPSIGLYAKKLYSSFGSSEPHVIEVISSEQQGEGKTWGPVKSGIFHNSDRFLAVQAEFKDKVLSEIVKWRQF